MIIDGDVPDVRSPRPSACRRLFVDEDGQTVVAFVSHGVWQGWHHIDVQESVDRVVVTAYIGTLGAIADRQAEGKEMTFVMKGVLRPVRIRLSAPLGGRTLEDGASPAAGSGPVERG